MAAEKEKAKGTRDKILEAALDLFSEKGFHATTTRKIAQKADVNEVTLFRHFSSKMDLFQEILGIVRQAGFNAEWLQDLDLDPVEAIRYSIESTLENIENHSQKFRILLYALLDRVEGFEENYVQKQMKIGYEFIINIFQKLSQEGRLLSDQDPSTLAGLLMSQIVATIHLRNLIKDHPLKDLSRSQISDSIVRLFIKQT